MLKKITRSIVAVPLMVCTIFNSFDVAAQRAVTYVPDLTSFESWDGTLPTGYSYAPSSLVYRGSSPGTIAGLYGIPGEGFGWQASSSTASLTLEGEYENTTGDVLTALEISYDAFTIVERESRIPSWVVSVNGVEVPELTWTFGDGNTTLNAVVSGLSIADGDVFTITFESDRGTGSGSTPMIGLDNISVAATVPTPSITWDTTNTLDVCEGRTTLSFVAEHFPAGTEFLLFVSNLGASDFYMMYDVVDSNFFDVSWWPGAYELYVLAVLEGVYYYSDTVEFHVNRFTVGDANTTVIANDDLYSSYFMGLEENTCNLIAVVSSTEDLGVITMTQNVGAPFYYLGRPMVGRYIDIHSSATTPVDYNVELHFSKADIDAYNALPDVIDGTFDSLAYDLTNIRVALFHGAPTDGTTGPNGQYDSTGMEEFIPIYASWYEPDGSFLVLVEATQFSGFFIYAESEEPLNVPMSPLAGVASQGVNTLSWSTYDAAEGTVFILQHSTDGIHYSDLDHIPSQNKAATYSFSHETPKGTDFYRLAITQTTGAISYSNVVRIESANQNTAWSVFPNPAANHFNVQINEKNQLGSELQVVDHLGRIVHQQSIGAVGTYQIDCSQWASGVYHVVWADGTQIHRTRVVKY